MWLPFSRLFRCVIHGLTLWQVQHFLFFLPRSFNDVIKLLQCFFNVVLITLSCFLSFSFFLLIPEAPSPSCADVSRSPPARSTLLRSSTRKSSQPEVSADDLLCAEHRGPGFEPTTDMNDMSVVKNFQLLMLFNNMWITHTSFTPKYVKLQIPRCQRPTDQARINKLIH